MDDGTLTEPLLVAHLDLDAFFAQVEELAKPSIRGRPVVVAGRGGRGVITTANYPARRFGVHSAMPSWQGRALAPHAVWLSPRGTAYSEHSTAALAPIRATFSRVEQVAYDEVYVDLSSARTPDELAALDPDDGPDPALAVHGVAWVADPYAACTALRQAVWDATGLTASVGVARHKLGAKLASESSKPAGAAVLDAAAEAELLPTLEAKALPGIGPVSARKLAGAGIRTVADVRAAGEPTVVGLLGQAHGTAVWDLAHGRDTRRVEYDRERKSVGAERTLPADLRDLESLRATHAAVFAEAHRRLLRSGAAARTVTVKVRYADFTIETRAASLAAPTDEEPALRAAAEHALAATSAPGTGVRLVGVAFSALDTVAQLLLSLGDEAAAELVPELAPAATPGFHPAYARDASTAADPRLGAGPADGPGPLVTEQSAPGSDVVHDELGRGWLVGAGHGVASVRFETSTSPPARSATVRLADGVLRHCDPEPPRPAAGPAPWKA
ncbi:DNA polymerase IV [Motilibacter aurantiacus]|uniref:DNA polymerase IV n=1 Tax=Motilibacter aurantiacus TaxID=2714955 RepID=UPI00140A6A4C|nr:DNA polymerase IV [Motilibacter aurantiacus]